MNNLKEARKAAGMTQAEVGSIVRVSQNTYSYWERGKVKIDDESLKKLADLFHVSVDYLLGRNEESPPAGNAPPSSVPGSKWIPVLGSVTLGIPISSVQDAVEYEEISPQMAATGEFFALRMEGTSMEPQICDGDVLIVRKQSDADSGDICIYMVNGGSAACKRIKKRPEGIMLVPNNSAHEPMFYSAEIMRSLPIQILGVVVEVRRRLK